MSFLLMQGDLQRRALLARGLSRAAMEGVGFPAWVLASGGVPATLDIDFINDRAWNSSALVSIASLLSCSRASTGYYLKADGTLQSFSSNVLRYGTNGLLVEEARTNLCLRSQEFDSATWTKNSATVSANAVNAPDGSATADKIVTANASAEHKVYQLITVASGSAYTWTIYGKAAERNWLFIDAADNTAGDIYTYFDLTNGVVGTVGAGCVASIEALASGWYRCRVTRTTSNIGAYMQAGVTTADNTPSSAGDGSSGLYAWGAQLELGAFPTSYIPTTASSATRAADVVTFSDLTWFDGAAESLYAEWLAKNTNNAKVWALDATNDVLLDEQTGMSARVADAGASFAITVGNTASAGATVKAAARMAANDIALCMNGGTVGTDTSATAPGTFAASRLGVDLSSGNALNSYIRRVAAFKSSLLNNAALQALTT